MDFALSPDLKALQERTRRFIADVVIPYEDDPRQGPHGPEEALRLMHRDNRRWREIR